MSAYDLLSDDDREALAWVREMGGVEAAKARMMPEGCEWPRFEDGEFVRFGDLVGGTGGLWMNRSVDQVIFTEDGSVDVFGNGSCVAFERGETARRIVLAADGEPLEVGQTVWDTDGNKLTVAAAYGCECYTDGGVYGAKDLTHQRPVLDADGNRIEPDMGVWWVCEGDERGVHAERLHVESIGEDGLVTCDPFNGGTWVELEPSELYVDKPVLDADGVLCREGDEVWEVRSHRRREIVGTHYRDYETGEPLILCDGDDAIPIPATCVTHAKPEPPDSWERIEEDATRMPGEYCERYGIYGDSFPQAEAMSCDLVRRCRALAERGER